MSVDRITGQNIISERMLETAALKKGEVVGVIVSRMIQAYDEAGGDLGRFVVTCTEMTLDDKKVLGPGVIVRIEGWKR